MVPLHDNTRRHVCRIAFALLCVVPTAGVSLWCGQRHLPAATDAEARRLEVALGLRVTLDGLVHPRPGQVRYDGLELADPETGQRILRCAAIDVLWQDSTDPQGQPRPSLSLVATRPEIESVAAARLTELLDRALGRRIAELPPEVRLVADETTLRTTDGPQTFVGLEGTVEWLQEGAQLAATFRLAGLDAADPIRIRAVRNRQCTPPATGLELDTGGAAVPCRLLAVGLPPFGQFGPSSRFAGHFWAGQTTDGHASTGWDGELTGQVLDVDLDRLVTDRFAHTLGGTARLTVHSARFRGERLEEATGTFAAGPGQIGRPLVEALAAQLGLARAALPPTPDGLVSYEQLAAAFRIDAAGLQVRGQCAGPVAGVILADDRGPLLGEPLRQPLPTLALVRALVPAAEVQVPATRQTDWLVGRLPVPAVASPTGEASASPLR